MEPSSCGLCIKSACLQGTNTPCEEELEAVEDWSTEEKNKEVRAFGIYTTPPQTEKSTTTFVYRAWYQQPDGGILGIPFPAKNKIRAESLARKGEEIFGALIELESLGKLFYK